MPRTEQDVTPTGRTGRWARRIAAGAVLSVGIVQLVLATRWRDLEAVISAHAIAVLTGQTTHTVPGRPEIVLFKGTSVESIFVLTGECTVAYLMVALLIGTAPLLLLRKLSPTRTMGAVTAALAVLVLANLARLTAIGATVSEFGRDPGLTIAHTYLGSVLTVVGTCAAGVVFAAILVGRSGRRAAHHGRTV